MYAAAHTIDELIDLTLQEDDLSVKTLLMWLLPLST